MDVNNEKKAIIELQGICKSFSVGKRTAKVLKGIDLSINNGEMTAIMGASGCGKSTLLNIIGCLDVAESGEYWLKGKKVTGKSQKEMAKIRNEIFGYVIQDFALIRDDTVNDPEILLADEPTGALDSKTGQEVMNILREICNKGKTIVIVTHDEKIARQCDRILCMKDGKI